MTKLHHGDCLEIMPSIPDKSIDMILCDLPYGTTACKWDVVIPFEPLWKEYKRIIKDRGCIALFGSEPFSSYLRMSNIKQYKYDWYWNKSFAGNFVQAKRMPLKIIESVSIFSCAPTMPKYNPLMEKRDKSIVQGGVNTSQAIPIINNKVTHSKKVYTEKYPVTLLNYKKKLGATVHPTQKPVALLEYLIKTYTLEGETVLDNCMGSGSTGVACINTNRNFIGIEKEKNYFDIAQKRIYDAVDDRAGLLL